MNAPPLNSCWSIFLIFLRLGLTSFGGPVAHLSYFKDEFIEKRQWLSKNNYADIVSLCQFLPGPASSQVGMILGFSQQRYLGALAAWLGFTLPSAIALILFAYGLNSQSHLISPHILHGLKLVTVAIVAHAVWSMAKSFCADMPRVLLMLGSACFLWALPSFLWGQIVVILIAGIFGSFFFSTKQLSPHAALPIQLSHQFGFFWLALFLGLFGFLYLLAQFFPNQTIEMINSFYKVGSLVFGGGHVVLPLLQTEVSSHAWITNEAFLAGYGLTQAMPGPLFTFAAFIGAATPSAQLPWLNGVVCLCAIFIPSFLLVVGVLPFWETLRTNQRAQAALVGINAAVVGILLSALYQPVWLSGILNITDFVLAMMAFFALIYWKLSSWIVVIATVFIYWALANISLTLI